MDFIAHTPLGEARALVQFGGQFEQQPVLWQATLIALEAPGLTSALPSPDIRANIKDSQFIDIANETSDGVERQVQIGLPVRVIDVATVLKTITMLRQYQNLRRGRHEFKGIHKQTS